MCVVIVGFWEVMSNRNRAPAAGFELTSEDLRGLVPRSDRWQIHAFPVKTTPMEPNIAAFQLRTKEQSRNAFLVRLVHGYNMCDCMRIKGYNVELITDTRRDTASEQSEDATHVASHPAPDNLQIWRLTSAGGDVSIWVTAMLRSGDFSQTSVDVRSMAFPRIGIPDDPSWAPRGITLRSLRHPIRNLRLALRAKWNNSRSDAMTFLGLRQPAWASEDILTLVTTSRGVAVRPNDEKETIDQALAAHTFMLGELRGNPRSKSPRRIPARHCQTRHASPSRRRPSVGWRRRGQRPRAPHH